MLELLIKFSIFLVMPISSFFVGKNLLNSNESFIKTKNILAIIGLIVANFLIYRVEYKYVITLLNFLATIICYKIIFKRTLFDSFIMSTILMILMFISEVILSICVLPFIPADFVRIVGIPMLLSNLFIGFSTVILSKIKFFNKFLFNLFSRFEKIVKFKIIVICFCWIIITSIICYFIFNSITNNIGFWIGSAVQICFLIFIIIFFRDKNSYANLNERFEVLYNYLEDMEEYMDSERLNIHEYKNQLSVIRDMSKNRKVIQYIDSIISDTKLDINLSSDLKNLPKGAFKALIYYKFMQANSKGLNITIDISSKCGSYFEELSIENMKEISRLLGIYLDNAIEASEKSKKKSISLEIYKTKNINIVISNSINENIDIKFLNKKGYTTKGSGRGHGLYLAKKLIAKNSNIESDTKIVNSYFIQKIILK